MIYASWIWTHHSTVSFARPGEEGDKVKVFQCIKHSNPWSKTPNVYLDIWSLSSKWCTYNVNVHFYTYWSLSTQDGMKSPELDWLAQSYFHPK